jgi:uncharacterized protein YceK
MKNLVLVLFLIFLLGGCSAISKRLHQKGKSSETALPVNEGRYVKREERKIACFIRLIKYEVSENTARAFCNEIIK